MATGFWTNGQGPASAIASVNADGTVSLVEGSPDIGGTRVVAAMHVAEVLGIAAEDVRPVVGDTDSVGFTSNTRGQRRRLQDWVGVLRGGSGRKEADGRARGQDMDISHEDVDYADGVLSTSRTRSYFSLSRSWRGC